ncbi:hypothetical protein GGI20_000463 [Coemansia sp. BCRC 34301]|nr:hypothetical protein GGI20_000463 [Coemansia sp. BCRC 34301]
MSTPSLQLQPGPSSSSDVDSEVQSNKPLFLNFTAELAPFSTPEKKPKKKNVYKVSGVNILNRNSVDSKTALERLQRRRENHNFVERRRRDNINHTITTLSSLIPYCAEEGAKVNKGSILHMAVEYIQDMQELNRALSAENIRLGGTGSLELPTSRPNRRGSSVISGLDTAIHSEEEDDEDDGEGEDDESSMPLMMRTSPQRSRKSSVGQNTSPSRKRSKADAPTSKRPILPLSSSSSSSSATLTLSRTSLASNHYHAHLPAGMASPPATANPSTAPSANTSPVAMGAVSDNRSSFAFTSVRSVPSTATQLTQSNRPPQLPPISSMTNGQTVAQSMPNSPNFRAATVLTAPLGVVRNSSSISSHPFFSNDVPSVRHNLQPHAAHPAYGSTTAPQSLQTTPMMRPNHDQTLNDKFELPPMSFNGDSTYPNHT